MRLIYLSAVTWSSFAQRPHKFVRWFHARTNAEVLWVDPYPTRFPTLADFTRPRPAPGAKSDVPNWLRVARVRALPIEPMPVAGWLNVPLWRGLLAQAEAFADDDETLLALGKPTLLALECVRRLRRCRTLYDAMDDFSAFYRGWSRRAMSRREQSLVRRVDSVWASSSALARYWRAVRADTQLVRNGLDAEALPEPRKRMRRAPLVFGYVGTIAAWFDWGIVLALARSRPLDRVRLIGPIYAPCPAPLPGNIELLPACEHTAALRAMNAFDVGLIPFKRTTLTAGVDPIKYYEYRALGLPVLSTPFGEMALRGAEPGVFLARDEADVGQVAAMAAAHDAPAAESFVSRNTWDARFDAACLPMMVLPRAAPSDAVD